MRHGLFFCRFRTGGDLGSFGARRGHGARRAGPRLRSGAFAPDFPCLILVIAYGDSFGFRWAYRRPTHRAPQPHRARGVGNKTGVGAGGLLGVFFAVLVVWKILRGPRCVGRAGGLAAHTRCGSVSGARCARMASRGKLDLSTGWRYLAVVASECSGVSATGSRLRIAHIRNF